MGEESSSEKLEEHETKQNLSGSLRAHVSVCQDHETLDSCNLKCRLKTLGVCMGTVKLFIGESFAITREACEPLKPMQFDRFSGSKHRMNIDVKYLLARLRTLVNPKMF